MVKRSHITVCCANNINEVVLSAIRSIDQVGELRDSRNGPVKSIYRAELIMLNPRLRYLDILGRKSNIFQMIAETFWVMSASDEINPYLSYFLPRAANYSDNGITWRGAYGPRIYNHGQLEGAVNEFERDGLDTRRAVVSIYQPDRDSALSLRIHNGLQNTKDLPCNNFINFWVDGDKNFNMDIFQRSGDIIWGTGSINLFEFSFLHECVFELVKKKTGATDLELGTYCQRVTNLHFYPEVVGEQVKEILRLNPNTIFNINSLQQPEKMAIDLGSIDCVLKMRGFFRKLVSVYTSIIQDLDRAKPDYWLKTIEEIFNFYGVPISNDNTLWVLNLVLLSYLFKDGNILLLNDFSSLSLAKCIENSHFRKF